MLRHISQGRRLPAHTSAGDPQALTGGSGSVSCGDHCSFVLSPGVHKILFVSFKGLCSLQSYGRSVIKPCWPSKSDSLGIPSSLAKSAGWGAWYWAYNFHNSVRTSLVLLFSSLSHPLSGYRFWFYHNYSPPTISVWLLFCPWMRVSFFFVGFQCLPVDGCSTTSCNFGSLARWALYLILILLLCILFIT